MNQNLLQVGRAEFKKACKVFTLKRLELKRAHLKFESGLLSINSGAHTAVMRAAGTWHGHASFSGNILRAIATAPPLGDPIVIGYADGHLLVGTMTVTCDWSLAEPLPPVDADALVLLDLLALARVPTNEPKGSDLPKRIRAAVRTSESRIRSAAAQLVELGVTEAEVRLLVEQSVQRRIHAGGIL